MNVSKEKMLEFIDHVDSYLRSGDGDWDITSHPDPAAEGALKAIRSLIESSVPADDLSIEVCDYCSGGISRLPPIRVTREWIGKLIHEGYLCGAYNDNQERFVSMLREKGIEVEEKP